MQGYSCKMYYKASALVATPDRSGWTELNIVGDVTLEDEVEASEITKRANAGRKAYEGGLRDQGITFELALDTTNAGYDMLKAAFEGKTMAALAVFAGAIATAEGVAGNWMVSSFVRNEPQGGEVTRSVTVKPNAFMTDFNAS